jgi:hypothetical protein
MAIFGTGCIVTDRPDYTSPEPNFPPSIQAAPGSEFALDRLNVVPNPSTGGDDAGTPRFVFDVYIVDPNLTQTLRANTILNTSPDVEPEDWRPREIPPSGSLERRVTFEMDPSRFTRRCNRLELVVSSAFQNDSARTPAERFDVATAVWYVAFDDAVSPPQLRECP